MVSHTSDTLSWFQYLLFFSDQDQASSFSSPSVSLLGKVQFLKVHCFVSIVQQPQRGTYIYLSVSPFLAGCYILPSFQFVSLLFSL